MENTRFDQIQQFIRGDLKGSELSDFNTLLASDTDLQQEVELYKLIDDAFIDKGLLDVKKKFANIDVFDIEVDAESPQAFIDTVVRIAPTFGGAAVNPKRSTKSSRKGRLPFSQSLCTRPAVSSPANVVRSMHCSALTNHAA